MALRDQPYIPLYVQDFLTDEKLNECSAEATGVYIKVMCVMHKSKEYGTILLKQKDKQNKKQVKNFACKLVKHLPYTELVILHGLEELLTEDVLFIQGDKLCQKRMIKDNNISIKRSKSGKKGGLKTQEFAKANVQANSESEDEINNIVKDIPTSIKWSRSVKLSRAGEDSEYLTRVKWWWEEALKNESWKGDIKELYKRTQEEYQRAFITMRGWLLKSKKNRRSDLNKMYRTFLEDKQWNTN